ncbi:MAG: hypothetical protein KatS3mg025_1408 [Bacteroidia bacterium]|nr:MAG: hypothetical protein KatS3mg025_1408 [Bacteroidia bacterium]
MLRLLDGGSEAIVTGDILTRAREIDRGLGGEYSRERLAEGAATCTLLYSVSAGQELVGCTEEELRIALLRPPLNPAQVSEVLGRLRNELWYLRYRDRRYFFTAKPNLNKVILDFEQGISEESVEESLRAALVKVAGQSKSRLQVLVAPAYEGAVNDPSRATLVLLPWSLGHTEAAQQWMKEVVARITHRNLLFFLAAEEGKEGQLRMAARRFLALQNLQQSQTFRELDKDDQEEVRRLCKEKEGEVYGLLLSMYQHLFRPAADGVEELRITLKRDGRTLVEMVEAALRERGILLESLSPAYLVETFKLAERPVTLAEIQTVLTGSPGQPVLIEPTEALSTAIRQGVEKGHFALQVSGQIFTENVPEEILKRSEARLVPVTTPAPPAGAVPAARPPLSASRDWRGPASLPPPQTVRSPAWARCKGGVSCQGPERNTCREARGDWQAFERLRHPL